MVEQGHRGIQMRRCSGCAGGGCCLAGTYRVNGAGGTTLPGGVCCCSERWGRSPEAGRIPDAGAVRGCGAPGPGAPRSIEVLAARVAGHRCHPPLRPDVQPGSIGFRWDSASGRVATAFLHDQAVGLLDGPSTSLDDEGVGLLRAALSSLLARGGAAIVCEPSARRGELARRMFAALEEHSEHQESGSTMPGTSSVPVARRSRRSALAGSGG